MAELGRKRVVVVIPVYKELPDEWERLSFCRCISILRKHAVCIVCPADFDASYYAKKLKHLSITYSFEYFESESFKNIAGYNRLLLSSTFYKRFVSFDYMLIYQMDAYVFKDELQVWCQKGYDYVGAPWINTDLKRWLFVKNAYPRVLRIFHRLTNGLFLRKVGNGGVSLRRVQSMISMLERFGSVAKSWKGNEDIFFSHFVSIFNPLFKIPGEREALGFAFDIFPAIAYEMNGFQLPFACHAFNRNDAPNYAGCIDFWKQHIAELNTIGVD